MRQQRQYKGVHFLLSFIIHYRLLSAIRNLAVRKSYRIGCSSYTKPRLPMSMTVEIYPQNLPEQALVKFGVAVHCQLSIAVLIALLRK